MLHPHAMRITHLCDQKTVQGITDVADAVPSAIVFVSPAVHPHCQNVEWVNSQHDVYGAESLRMDLL